MDQTWFKVRIMLPYENDLISKLRETLMDTLEHNTVAAGHPSLSVMPDNNLITLGDTIFTKSWQRGTPHDVSRVCFLVPVSPLIA